MLDVTEKEVEMLKRVNLFICYVVSWRLLEKGML